MAASSSSLASHRLEYDVFLNFRGEDTRRGFTSHLYAALRRKAVQTFFDDDDLRRGEEIAQSLPEAIQDSTVAIVVFSKDYASSRWCLDELADIMDCHRSLGQIVIPVFYGVDPSHLRRQSHDVAVAFVKHEQNPMNARKIPRWKNALTAAASLSGFHSNDFRNDDLLINKIVEDTLERWKEKNLSMKNTIQELENKLMLMSYELREVRMKLVSSEKGESSKVNEEKNDMSRSVQEEETSRKNRRFVPTCHFCEFIRHTRPICYKMLQMGKNRKYRYSPLNFQQQPILPKHSWVRKDQVQAQRRSEEKTKNYTGSQLVITFEETAQTKDKTVTSEEETAISVNH